MSMDHSTLLCPKCQHPITATLAQFKILGCMGCGSISALNKNGHLDALHSLQPVNDEHQEPFQLGRQLQYQKNIYTVAAVFRYHVDYKEWDREDSKWVQEYGFIKEWYTYDDQGKLLIIMRDTDKKYYLVSNPSPAKFDQSLRRRDAVELGEYKLWGLAGVDPDELEKSGFYRIYGSTRYECADENFEKGTILQYTLNLLPSVRVKRMLILNETEQLSAKAVFSTTTFYRNLFGFALLFVLGLLVFNIGMSEGKIQYSPYIYIAAINAEGELDTMAIKPRLAGTFDLIANKNYRLTAISHLSETNQSADYSLTIVRQSDAAVVGDVALAFYTESGYDDEGSWEENLLEDHLKFQVNESGKYQIFIAPDYENLGKLPKAGLEIQIAPASYTLFYLCVSSVFLLLWLIFQWQRENIVAYANLPHDTLFHDIYDAFQ